MLRRRRAPRLDHEWHWYDADSESGAERELALRHNREQAKWLPGYMLRWAVGGAVMLALETLSE